VGDDNNNNPNLDGLYKCDANGNRNIAGQYMILTDPRGLFFRNAGENSRHAAADGTLYNGGTPGSFGSFGGFGAPDYVHRETTNRIPNNGGSWTATSTGYVVCQINLSSDQQYAAIYVNGVRQLSAYGLLDDILPISAGETVSFSSSGAFSSSYCYFMPQILDKASTSMVALITY
jgi:hypothetical protein